MANRLNVANIGYNDATDALTIDSSGNVTASGTLSAGTISEAVADAGVSIDGVVAKDSKVFAPSGIVFASAEITGDDAGTTNRVESTNLLDDYEEGTWTPTANSYSTINSIENATYTKVGRKITLNAWVKITTTNADFSIGGFPVNVSGRTAASLSSFSTDETISNQCSGDICYCYGASILSNKDLMISITYNT